MDLSEMLNSTKAMDVTPFRPGVSKIIAMVALAAGSLLFGLMPAFLSIGQRRRQPLMISNLLCFGAGVLLATSLVHMLPEVREHLPKYSELFLCSGFFIVYVVDELVHLLCGETFRHTHNDHVHAVTVPTNHSHGHTYGSTTETSPLLNDATLLSESGVIRQIEDTESEEANARICHTAHTEPCEQSSTGHAGLLVALSIHSVLEGLAIGVQDTASKVFVLLGAVCCHKFVVGFCLGVELCSTPGSHFSHQFLAIFIFAAGSVVGIGVGMGLTDVTDIYEGPALQVLQALAAGTLLYVTVCEVLPREKARWHMSSKRYAGLFQCISVIIGFTAMTLLTIFYSA